MTGIVLCGSWRVTVTRKDSDWAQRVVVTGGVDAVIPGVVGAAATISGDRWDLTVEHDPGCGWRPSAYVAADPVREHAGHATRTVMSKDHYWRGDSDPNDLVLRLEHAGAHLAVACAPQVVGRFLAVTVRNTGFRTFGYDSVLDVTDAGRSVLARWGVVLAEHWEPSALRETGQEAYGRAVLLRPLEVGDEATVRFPLLSVSAGPYESAEVEFALTCDGRVSRVRHLTRAVDLRRAAVPLLPSGLARPRTVPPACGPTRSEASGQATHGPSASGS